jgi:hypothetical protein
LGSFDDWGMVVSWHGCVDDERWSLNCQLWCLNGKKSENEPQLSSWLMFATTLIVAHVRNISFPSDILSPVPPFAFYPWAHILHKKEGAPWRSYSMIVSQLGGEGGSGRRNDESKINR